MAAQPSLPHVIRETSPASEPETARLRNRKDIEEFIFGGRAKFTLRNTETGKRFTYRLSRASNKPAPEGVYAKFKSQRPYDPQLKEEDLPIFVSVLTGSDNMNDYTYLGTIFPGQPTVTLTKKSKIGRDAPSFRGIAYLLKRLFKKEELPEFMEVWHEGACCRCGRTLTDPASIARGIGPVCLQGGEDE